MGESELQEKLLAAARAVPDDDRVPYAFEKRIMAQLAGRRAVDPMALWGHALWRGAVFCVALVAVLFVGSLFMPSPNTETLPQAVESALLAAMDNNLTQIGDTP